MKERKGDMGPCSSEGGGAMLKSWASLLLVPLLAQLTCANSEVHYGLSLHLKDNKRNGMQLYLDRGVLSEAVAANLRSCSLIINNPNGESIVDRTGLEKLPGFTWYQFPPAEQVTPQNDTRSISVYEASATCTFSANNRDVSYTSNTINVIPGVTEPDYSPALEELDSWEGADRPQPVPDNSHLIFCLIGGALLVMLVAVVLLVLFLGKRGTAAGLCVREPSTSQTELNTQDVIEEIRAHRREQKARSRNNTSV